ncbi:hypothetical protein TcG_13012, partial [Trypanosoma cruzi]
LNKHLHRHIVLLINSRPAANMIPKKIVQLHVGAESASLQHYIFHPTQKCPLRSMHFLRSSASRSGFICLTLRLRPRSPLNISLRHSRRLISRHCFPLFSWLD